MINSKLILIGIFCTSSFLTAQNLDYMITKQHDTIYGKINWNFHYILTDHKKRKLELSSNTIKECYIYKKNVFYESNGFNDYNGKSNFRKRIVSGNVKMYEAPVLDNSTIYYIEKNDSILTKFMWNPFTNKKRHKLVQKIIRDKPLILQEFDKMSGNIKNIMSILEKYNKSDNTENKKTE